jgi:hypothetical protein
MTGPRRLILAILLLLCSAAQSGAQTVVDRNRSARTTSRESVYPAEPFGGFGLDVLRTPIASREWVDRFGMVHSTGPAPTSPVLTPRRSGSKTLARSANRGLSKNGNRRTNGSLDRQEVSEIILYAPEFRYRSYGGGYGFGPYGSIDCSIMYKGMSLGY